MVPPMTYSIKMYCSPCRTWLGSGLCSGLGLGLGLANPSPSPGALSFESLTRENEETFYHCDQLIKGMYSIFFRRWQREHRRLLPLRAEEYYARPKVLYLPTYLPTFTTHAMITLPNLVVPHTLYSLSIRPYYTMLSILCALYRPCSRAPCVSSAWGHRQTMRAGRPFSLLRPMSLAAVQREGRRR